MLGWFKSKEVEDFAKTLAQDFVTAFPPALEAGQDGKNQKKFDRALFALKEKSARYHGEKNLGWFKKAQLANTLKWELKEKGYSGHLADRVTHSLLLGIAYRAK